MSINTEGAVAASFSGSQQHILPMEQQFLEMYFTALSNFAYDRAKELVVSGLNRPGISTLRGQGHFHFAKGSSTSKS